MNKQEALKQIEEQRDMILNLHGWSVFGYIKGIINQLDEPPKIELPKAEFKKSPKITIPQFVANWYEENKDDFETSLFQCVYELLKKRNDNELNEFEKWVIDENTEPFKTLVNMHQFGYEVEEEKRYKIEVKGVSENSVLIHDKTEECWFFEDDNNEDTIYVYHTRKELEEAGFGWVFSCEGIEIEEVTD